MSELELKIEQLIKDQILITESEAQDLATLICNLPEIKGGQVGAEVSGIFGEKKTLRTIIFKIIIRLLRLLNNEFILLRMPKEANLYLKLNVYEIENLEINIEDGNRQRIRVELFPYENLMS